MDTDIVKSKKKSLKFTTPIYVTGSEAPLLKYVTFDLQIGYH